MSVDTSITPNTTDDTKVYIKKESLSTEQALKSNVCPNVCFIPDADPVSQCDDPKCPTRLPGGPEFESREENYEYVCCTTCGLVQEQCASFGDTSELISSVQRDSTKRFIDASRLDMQQRSEKVGTETRDISLRCNGHASELKTVAQRNPDWLIHFGLEKYMFKLDESKAPYALYITYLDNIYNAEQSFPPFN